MPYQSGLGFGLSRAHSAGPETPGIPTPHPAVPLPKLEPVLTARFQADRHAVSCCKAGVAQAWHVEWTLLGKGAYAARPCGLKLPFLA